MAAVVTVAGLVWSASMALAQNSLAANLPPTTAVGVFAPPLAYGVPEILQLARAKVGETTIIAFIKNSGNSYGLNADQIIYLRQQGISDAVITTMLNQPRTSVAAAVPIAPAPSPVASIAYGGQASTAMVAPAATYVQTAPESTYYSQPYYSQPYYSQPDYYYPDYAWYPTVPFYFGLGGGYYGSGWRGGGYGGGRYGGGGHSGGGHGGGHR